MTAAAAVNSPASVLGYLRQYPNGRFRNEARNRFAAFRAPVPGGTYTGSTATGSQVRLTVNADGTAVTEVAFGLAAAEVGVIAPTIVQTACFFITSFSLVPLPATPRSPVGAPIADDERTFSATTSGRMGLFDGGANQPLAVEAVASGVFSDSRVQGTVAFTFPERRGCDSRQLSWSARIDGR